MPIYEYECEKCLLRFELKRSFGEDGRGYCPRCGSEARRLFSPIPIIFKGSGFYQTDYRSESYKQGKKNDTKSTAGKDATKKKSDTKAKDSKSSEKPKSTTKDKKKSA